MNDETPQRVRLVVGALLLVLLLAALDQTIVSTALPTIVGDLGGISKLSKQSPKASAKKRPNGYRVKLTVGR